MSNTNNATPVTAPATPEPTTDAEFQAAAVAALDALPQAETAPDSKEATGQSAHTNAEVKTSVPAPKTEPEVTKEEAPPPELKKGFDALALEKAKARRREAETAERLKLLEKYEAAQTPLDLLMAKGFSYDDATRQILKGQFKPQTKEAPEESLIVKEIQELKRQLAEERTLSTRREVENKVASYAKINAEKYPFITARQAERAAFQYLQDYVAETNELPGKDIDESIALSFQALENDLERQVTEAANILTKVKKSAISVPASNEKAVQAESSQATQKTLTNSMASPGKAPKEAEPQTAEDYQRLALARLEALTTR